MNQSIFILYIKIQNTNHESFQSKITLINSTFAFSCSLLANIRYCFSV